MRVSFRRYDTRMGIVGLLFLVSFLIIFSVSLSFLFSKTILVSSLSAPSLVALQERVVTKGVQYTVGWTQVPGAVYSTVGQI